MLYILDSWTMEIGFRNSIVCWIPDSFSWITDSNVQDSGFHQHWKIWWIPENPDYLRSFNLPPITPTNCLGGVNDTLTVFFFFENFKRTTFSKDVLGTGHYLSPGAGAEDLGINKVKFSRSFLSMLLHESDPPPLSTDPHFCSPKIKRSPPKILFQVMNNHRSLMVILFLVSRSHHWRHDRLDIRGLRSCTFLLCGAPAKELLRWGIYSPTRQNNPRGAGNVCWPKSSHKKHGIMKK